METVIISKIELENMRREINRLRELEKIDFDLVGQFNDSLEDVKAGRIRRVA